MFAAALAAVAAPLAGCHDFGDVTGSISQSAASAPPADETKLRAYADDCGKRYERNPGEKIASIEYARALRALTRYSEAVAVIQTAAIKAPRISTCSANTARRWPTPVSSRKPRTC
jgi:Flp pilus assembly protein TadD